MPDVEELKSRARRAEAAGDYRLALESYEQALERERETTDPDMMDPALRLRVADLRFRLGQPEEALDAYLRASELYARQGLIPNAIAVCNKVLGVYPDHIESHRLLAELQLEIGLTADARNNFLRYLDEAVDRGRTAAAREAGRAFLSEEPDQEVAIALAEMLAEEGRPDRALQVLRDVWEKRTGLRQPAGRIEDFARKLDPAADLSEWQPVWPPPRRRKEAGGKAGGADAKAGGQDARAEEQEPEVAAGSATTEEAAGSATTAAAGTSGTDAAAAGAEPAAARERTSPPANGQAEEELTGPAEYARRTAAALEEPPTETGNEEAPSAARYNGASVPDAEDPPPRGRGRNGDAPLGEPLTEARGAQGEPPEETGGPRGPGAPSSGAPSSAAPSSAAPSSGDEAPAHAAPDREAELRRGLRLVEEMLEVAPDHLDLHRRRVLYARRLGDLRLLERALVELGEVLLERGSHRGARFVFEEVREQLNPGSARASEGLRRLDRLEESPGERESGEASAGAAGPSGPSATEETGADREFRRRLREALSSSSREMAWLHAAAESCGSGGSGPVPGPSHELMGRYLLMRGRPEEAAEHLQTALDRSPSEGERPAELLYHLGRAWRRADQPERARDCFERLAGVDSDFRAAWAVVDPDVR